MTKDELIEKLQDNYLDEAQFENLIDLMTDIVKRIARNLNFENLSLNDDDLMNLGFTWATWEILDSEVYQEYVRKLLIPESYIYLIRDLYFLKMSGEI